MLSTICAKGYYRRWEFDDVYKECRIGEYHMIRMYSANVDPQIISLFLSSISAGRKELSKTEEKLLFAPAGKLD